MKLHANEALTLNQRRRLAARVVEQGWTLTKAEAGAEVSVRCARKWVRHYRADGDCGLLDRSSAPPLIANRTDERRLEATAALRRLRFTGPEIAVLQMALVRLRMLMTSGGPDTAAVGGARTCSSDRGAARRRTTVSFPGETRCPTLVWDELCLYIPPTYQRHQVHPARTRTFSQLELEHSSACDTRDHEEQVVDEVNAPKVSRLTITGT